MAYGSKKTSDGKDISADDSKIAPSVGIVQNCTIKGDGFVMSDDGTNASITFVQESGAEVNHKEWNNDEEKSIDDTNRRIKHICTKLVSEAEYNQLPECNSFEEFINAVNKLIAGKTGGKFRMIFHYNNKGYVCVPRYPNFIEKMETVPSKLVISAYVQSMLTKKPKPQADPELAGAGMPDLNTNSDGTESALPF